MECSIICGLPPIRYGGGGFCKLVHETLWYHQSLDTLLSLINFAYLYCIKVTMATSQLSSPNLLDISIPQKLSLPSYATVRTHIEETCARTLEFPFSATRGENTAKLSAQLRQYKKGIYEAHY